jgi:hypothetical protein
MTAMRLNRNDPCRCGSGKKYKVCCMRSQFSGGVATPVVRGDGAYHERRPQIPPTLKPVVILGYTFADAFGSGEVTYAFPLGQLFCITDGRILRASQLTVGMEFHLQDGMIATVVNAEHGVRHPAPPIRDPYGNVAKRVVGSVKYTGWYPIIPLTVGDFELTTTPAHRFYSLDHGRWVEAESLVAGDRLLHPSGKVVRVNRVGITRIQRVELYNFEVEDYHTYFVGDDGNAVWSHNGIDGSCGVPKPREPNLLDGLPDPDGPLANGIRTLRPNQYDATTVAQGQVLRGTEEMRAVVGNELVAEGTHTDALSGLFSFVRQGGGAGFQGVTRNPLDRSNIVVRNFKTSSGEVMVEIDLTRLDPARVFDFGNPVVRDSFLARYPTFEKMVNRMIFEGVVPVRGNIPVEALNGLVRIPKDAPPDVVLGHLRALVGGG